MVGKTALFLPRVPNRFMYQGTLSAHHSGPTRTRALSISSSVASLSTIQPHAARARSAGALVARHKEQGNCKSDEYQPQYSEGLSATDHDQDGSLFAFCNCGENYDDPTNRWGLNRASFPLEALASLRKLKPPKDDEFGSGEADYLAKLCRLFAKMEPGDQKLLVAHGPESRKRLSPEAA